MKITVSLRREADPKFNGVARTIAQGDPPKWLAVGLTQFSQGIGSSDTDDIDISTIIERMQGAADTLITWLPIFGSGSFGLPCPDEVLLVLGALPAVKKDLDRLAKATKGSGRRPNARRDVCAAVVATAWKLLHGKVEPQSLKLQGACTEYWQACGGKQIGGSDLEENWRRRIERAADHSWIEDILVAVQNEP